MSQESQMDKPLRHVLVLCHPETVGNAPEAVAAGSRGLKCPEPGAKGLKV